MLEKVTANHCIYYAKVVWNLDCQNSLQMTSAQRCPGNWDRTVHASLLLKLDLPMMAQGRGRNQLSWNPVVWPFAKSSPVFSFFPDRISCFIFAIKESPSISIAHGKIQNSTWRLPVHVSPSLIYSVLSTHKHDVLPLHQLSSVCSCSWTVEKTLIRVFSLLLACFVILFCAHRLHQTHHPLHRGAVHSGFLSHPCILSTAYCQRVPRPVRGKITTTAACVVLPPFTMLLLIVSLLPLLLSF